MMNDRKAGLIMFTRKIGYTLLTLPEVKIQLVAKYLRVYLNFKLT